MLHVHGDIQTPPLLGHGLVDRQDPVRETTRQASKQVLERQRRGDVTASKRLDAPPKLPVDQHAGVQRCFVGLREPGSQARVRALTLPKFRDDVRVDRPKDRTATQWRAATADRPRRRRLLRASDGDGQRHERHEAEQSQDRDGARGGGLRDRFGTGVRRRKGEVRPRL